MTYTELSNSLVSWLNRNNFNALDAEIPTFFQLAQERIERDPRFRFIPAQEIVTVSTALPFLPTGFRKAISYNIPSRQNHEINGAPVKEVQKLAGKGTPRLVAPVGVNFIFGPEPDAEYDIEVVYQKALDPVSPTNPTNTLASVHPSLILFAALFEACMWLKDDARATIWEQRFNKVMRGLEANEENRRYEGGALQVRTSYECH